MKPIITVVVPYYKTSKLRFRRCIESLLAQSFKDFELLLIDDGNKNGFHEIEQKYEKEDERIHFVHKVHEGVSSARNIGIKLAQGQYLAFADADDYVDASFLDKCYKGIQDSDLVICSVGEQYFPVYEGWNDGRVFWSQPIYYNGLQYINFSVNKLYKLDIIRKNKILFPPDVKLGEDALFLDQYFSYCNSIRCVGDILYYYVPNEKSAIHQFQPLYWEWEQQVMVKQWERFHIYNLSTQNETGMIKWLYIKFRGAFYYYIDNMKDSQELRIQLSKMVNSDIFNKLMNGEIGKANRHLTRNERYILQLWKTFGVHGIIRGYQLGRLKRC